MITPYLEIPTYDNGTWSETVFYTREEYKAFALSVFKEPGQYNFDETSLVFNEQARNFQKNGYYCQSPFKSKDFLHYWDEQKNRCRKGVIFKNSGNTWFITRDYYMWLNFLPIYDKEEKRFDFAKVRDAQYHMALYELLAELHYQHAIILKKRQIASSYFHMAKLLNTFWFEEGSVLKIGASLKNYINEGGSWKFLNEYRNFLNEHTAWYRPCDPDKVFSWQQRIKVRIGGRDTFKGNKSSITGISFEKDPTNGVGGPVTYFFHEEAGIAPKMNDTYGFMRPAMRSGFMTTGMFIAAGSVGDLDQCEPMKLYVLHPEDNDFYAVKSNLIDNDGTIGMTGLFIPEQWSMPPFIDQWGNSLVEEALAALAAEFERLKKNLEPAAYQLEVSQRPRSIEEAFATRKVQKFPSHLVSRQLQRIADKEYPVEYVELERQENGKILQNMSRKLPIMDFPISKKTENKEAVICIYERPIKDAPWGTYYGSIDPVGEGKAEYINNKVYTPNGKKRIGDLKVGDQVIGSNGLPTNVTGVYPQGKKDLYRVTFNDGFSVVVCDEHLFALRSNGGERQDHHVLSIKQLLDKHGTLKFNGTGKNITKEYIIPTYYKKTATASRWRIPIVKPINYPEKELDIDPYLLGALLGDGGMSTRGLRFTTADPELLRYISDVLQDDVSIKPASVKVSGYDYRLSTSKGHNPITKRLRELGLQGKTSAYKFIPEEYKTSSVAQRLALLQGLMDTDGSCTNHGAEFYSVSKVLAYDVVELVQSLGGIAKIRKKSSLSTSKSMGLGYCYIVRVILPEDMNPFRLKRKATLHYTPKVFSRYIRDIQFEKVDEAVCISVDAEDHLYVTEHAIVTHNTTTSESLCSIIIYKNPIEITKTDAAGNTSNYIERDKIVATWCGRFDDINKTHERLELLIEYYNAWTICENNISGFIQHMIGRRKQKYLVPKDMILFLKDLGANKSVYSEYGWRNTGTLFKNHMLSYGIEFIMEELDSELDNDGNITRVHYGIERIPDPMLLKEMQAYTDGLNVDRLVTFCALASFAKVQQSNRGLQKRVEVESDKLENSQNFSKLSMRSPFRHLGNQGSNASGMNRPRSAFKNFK